MIICEVGSCGNPEPRGTPPQLRENNDVFAHARVRLGAARSFCGHAFPRRPSLHLPFELRALAAHHNFARGDPEGRGRVRGRAQRVPRLPEIVGV